MPPAASITVRIPSTLRGSCAGAPQLEVTARNVGLLLEQLERRYPELHRQICDETGAVRRHVNLFVNTHHMRDRDGLGTSLSPGDEVTILPAVSGG